MPVGQGMREIFYTRATCPLAGLAGLRYRPLALPVLQLKFLMHPIPTRKIISTAGTIL